MLLWVERLVTGSWTAAYGFLLSLLLGHQDIVASQPRIPLPHLNGNCELTKCSSVSGPDITEWHLIMLVVNTWQSQLLVTATTGHHLPVPACTRYHSSTLPCAHLCLWSLLIADLWSSSVLTDPSFCCFLWNLLYCPHCSGQESKQIYRNFGVHTNREINHK